MTDPRAPIGEDDLQAYVDERLDAARLALVRHYLEEHPEAAARVQAFVEQRDMLCAALAAKAEAPIPARLRVAHLRAGLRQRRWQQFRAAAAAVLLLLAGAGAGWLARGGWEGGPTPSPPMAEAAQAHRILAAVAHRPGVPARAEREELADWLAQRLGAPVVVPDLSDSGFLPVDGHLLPSAEGLAAMVLYEGDGGAHLSFYLRPAPNMPAARLQCADQPGGLLTYFWSDGRLAYAVTAAMQRAELRGIAFAAERQVRAGPRPAPRQPHIANAQPPQRICLG